MGLLDKVLNTDDVKKEKNPLNYKNSLLRKAENILSDKDSDSNVDILSKKKKIKVLIDTFFSTPFTDDFNLKIPINNFNFFKHTFSLTKGAAFFADENGKTFLPWISTGYDKTTSSRLRLTKDDLVNFSENNFNIPFFIPKSRKTAVKKYFSTREYGLLDDILVIPYSDNNRDLVSFFLVTELNSVFTTYEELFKYASYFLKKSIFTITHFCRNRKNVKDSTHYLSSGKIMNEVSSHAESEKHDSFFILFINTDTIVNKLFKLSSDIITTGFNMEIYRIFSALTVNGGKIFTLPGNSLFLIINSDVLLDKALLKHQINILLKNMLPDLDDRDSEFLNIFSYPADTLLIKDFINV